MIISRGLMVGRFQPFHNGHLELAKQILSECDELIIVIGSAQFNYIDKDPFTAGERITMIHEALKESGAALSKCYIIPMANDENNARWLAYLKSIAPPFNVLYSGNDFVKHLALSLDVGGGGGSSDDCKTNASISSTTSAITIKPPKFARKEEYNGTNIRRLIIHGKPWKHLVPDAVARIMEQVNGVERIKVLAGSASDSNPQKW